MTVSLHTYSATLLAPDLGLPFKDGKITLDEGWAPYVKGDLTLALPTLATLTRLDPRTNPRIRIVTTCTFIGTTLPATTRTFNVVLRERKIDHVSGTVRLELASDEALLQDYSLVATTPLQRPDTSGVAAIKATLTLVLGAAPIVAATITTTTLTNMLPNPGGETNTAGWVPGGGNGVTIARVPGRTGAAGIGAYTDGGAVMAVIVAPNNTPTSGHVVTPGKAYTFSVWARCTKQYYAILALRFFDTNGNNIGRDEYGDSLFLSTTRFDRATVTATAPPGAAYCWPIFYTDGSNGSATYTIDDAMLHEGAEPLPSFSGATPSTPDVTYSWAGTANASMSRAIVKGHVQPAATSWQPGVTAWDYLDPILTALQLRLFCDEQRVWRLVDSTYKVAGSIRITEGRNVTDAADTISRASVGEWYDAVVITYEWTTDGVTNTATDVASVPGYGKVLTVKKTTPYPGPGAAEYILKRAQGKGRILNLSAISDYSAQPGIEIVATLPSSPIQTGYVTAVTWDLATDEMQVSSRGVTDSTPTAWAVTPTGRRWMDVPAGVAWNTYTP